MPQVESLQGKAVMVAHYRSVLGRDGTGLVGLRGRVVWDEGGEEVVVAFDHAVDSGGYPTDQPNRAWIYRDWLEQPT
jgi:hypothetical protein